MFLADGLALSALLAGNSDEIVPILDARALVLNTAEMAGYDLAKVRRTLASS
jgi:hypothetical protein